MNLVLSAPDHTSFYTGAVQQGPTNLVGLGVPGQDAVKGPDMAVGPSLGGDQPYILPLDLILQLTLNS